MVMYQIPQTSDGQSQFTGSLPVASMADVKPWTQTSESTNITRLEAEVRRLQTALLEKTHEANGLRNELNSVLVSIRDQQQRSRLTGTPVSGASTPPVGGGNAALNPAASDNNNTEKAASDPASTSTAVVNGVQE